jgi:nickel transport protein
MIRLILVAALLLALVQTGLAHRVNVFAWLEGDEVHVEGAFPGGRPVAGGTVRVVETDTGRDVLTGETDEAGTFVFTLPKRILEERPELTIVLEAGEGHQDQWPLPARDYLADAPSAPKPRPAVESAPPPVVAKRPMQMDEHLREEMKAELSELLDRKLRALESRLEARETQRITATEIFGGIGYIFGLAGVAMLVYGRKH